jgi:hypothetical protein
VITIHNDGNDARTPNAKYIWSLNAKDVDNDGNYDIGGISQPLMGVELRPPPPDDDTMFPVISQRLAIEVFKACPSCGVHVGKSRLVFACGKWSVYPCASCRWVWVEQLDTLEKMA